MEGPPEDAREAQRLGERLRDVRQQQALSLHDVEALSGGELKASVVGAYERGERTISIVRLQRLARFFRVPVAELLPAPRGPLGEVTTTAPSASTPADRVVIDLVALEERRGDEPALARYVQAISARRGDYNGRVLTVRAADLETLAAVTDDHPNDLRNRLIAIGLVRTPQPQRAP